jgi:hypothetical protein
MTGQVEKSEPQHRVRVWFGSRVIADWTGSAERADHPATFMTHRFGSLRLRGKNEAIADSSKGGR